MAGLAPDEAQRRLATSGRNELPRRSVPGWATLFIRQVVSPLMLLLLVAAPVSAVLGELADAGFILLVIVINGVIGAVQERKAERGAAALDRLVSPRALVRRDGGREEIDARCLAPGDVVELEPGASVPADLRLLETSRLAIDESLLTGESLPAEKNAAPEIEPASPMADRINLAHAGSIVLRGRGCGVIVATGAQTEIGRIASALTSIVSQPPLVRRLQRFSRSLAVGVVAAVGAFAVAQAMAGYDLAEIFFVAVALAVSAVPEGLPIAVTVALSVAAHRMARRNVIVRSLPAVEGLGACTMIASDKTGTLTRNQLSATTAWLPGIGRVAVDAVLVRAVAEAACICNEATLEDGRPVGDTVDIAFVVLAQNHGVAEAAFAARASAVGVVAYEPQQGYAACFLPADVVVKGAPERVLEMCAATPGASEAAEAMASEGVRVLAVARGPGVLDAPLRGLSLLGLVGLIDPTRPEAADAVRRSLAAGVRVCMVTGDHPATALAIARDLGIAVERDAVTTGTALAAAGVDEVGLRRLVERTRVFARIEPLQKLTIVRTLQAGGHAVAVTGDGVNDAPALAAADIGVAMGRGGTDAARQSADLILSDDNFASIVSGIEEGRLAYANIRKVVAFLLATSAAEIGLFFLCLAAGLPLPLFALQLLWLNLVTDSIQHVALSLEPAEPGLMEQGPRRPGEPLLDRRLFGNVVVGGLTMAVVGTAFFYWLLAEGRSVDEARNLLLLLMVCFENAHVLNSRSESGSVFRGGMLGNPWVIVVIALTQAVHIGAMFVPGLSDVLRIAPVSPGDWLQVAGLALTLIVAMELWKALCRRR